MHEFSICKSIVDVVLAELAKIEAPRFRLKSVRVIAGKYRQIIPQNLEFAFEVLVKDTPADGSILEVKMTPVIIRCKACNWEGEIQLPLFLCGRCGGGNIDVIGGKELFLESMEVETND